MESFRHDKELEVAIYTGTGRGFCAGEDMKESLSTGTAGGRRDIESPFMDGSLEKPVIAAVNGFAMGGGFMLVERTDLRVSVPEAVFEVSEAKRWLLGGYNHGHVANLPYPIAMEMAFGFRFTAERLHQVGFLNRVVPADQLIPTAMGMAEHLLSLPPASRVNTVHMMRRMRPEPSAQQDALAKKLHEHGDKSDLMESRRPSPRSASRTSRAGSTRKTASICRRWKVEPHRRFTPVANDRGFGSCAPEPSAGLRPRLRR